jgi:hypothetical protein
LQVLDVVETTNYKDITEYVTLAEVS